MIDHLRRSARLIALSGLAAWGGAVNLLLLGRLVAPLLPPVLALTQFTGWILLGSVLIFVLTFTLRAPVGWLMWLLPGVIAFGGLIMPVWFPNSPPEAEGTRFTAMTFNVLGNLADPDQIFAVIRDSNANLVGLQEVRPTLRSKLQTELSDQYPYQISKIVQGYDGYALLSRYPILEHEIVIEFDFDTPDLNAPRYLRAVVDLAGQPVVVYVLHPPVPAPNPYDDSIMDVLLTFDDTVTQNYVRRAVTMIDAETLPVIVLCDCNSTPYSRQYRALDARLDEAFGAQGWGLGYTYPTNMAVPALRIDYVWYDDHFVARAAKVGREAGTSDHYPLWAELVLKAE